VPEIGGRKIANRRAGSGHPLLLLHGAWSDGREWRAHLAEAGPTSFDVIAWDAPPLRRLGRPAPKMGMADYADAVATCTTHTRPHRPVGRRALGHRAGPDDRRSTPYSGYRFGRFWIAGSR
jgi:pimeloyl-ACP methyl ester carboxylesterase